MNVWGIVEFEGDGVSCPIIPRHLPWYTKALLFVLRFGLCPICIIMSLAFSLRNAYQRASV